MRPADLLKASDQNVVGGIQIHDLNVGALGQIDDRFAGVFKSFPPRTSTTQATRFMSL
jgi:hypothetical protein